MLWYCPNTKPPEVFGCVGLWPFLHDYFWGSLNHFSCFRPRTWNFLGKIRSVFGFVSQLPNPYAQVEYLPT